MYTYEHMDRNVLYTFVTVTCIVFLPQVLTNCSSGCTDCRGNTCNGCQVGMWLDGNVCNKCPDKCSSCIDNNYCQSCEPTFWGIRCEFNCSDNCAGQGCNTEGNCYACNADWYGIQCYQDCKLCQNEQCNNTHCTYGCKPRFYQFNDGNNSDCRPCPSNCETCINETFCTQCSTNFYINKFTLSTTGRAQALCVSCLDTTVCSACQNISKCTRCSVIDGNLVCDRCEQSYTLDDGKCYIVVCSMHCLTGCNDLDSCLGECELGYSGTSCGYKCSDSNCLKCSKTANSECEICKSSYYTPTCDKQCSQNCLRGNTTCTLQDGYCLNGCIHNHWGNTCENLCPVHCRTVEGIPEGCDTNTGTCSHGCKEGFRGLNCNESFAYSQSTLTMKETIVNNPNGRGILGAAIGGSIAGVLMIVALTVATVFYLHKRKSLSKGNQENNMNTYYNMSMEPRQAIEPEDIRIAEHRTSSLSQQRANLYEHLADENRQNPYSQLDRHIDEASQVEESVQENNEYYNV